ncbi:MAG: DUF3849 domain-containing protein [Clostridia bacterium]|nr:DUF3849 domain-containing protein [Clostridia bacterium]
MEQMKQIPVYRQTGMYAREHGELEQFRQSNVANIACRAAIEKAIAENFDGMRLRADAAEPVLSEFGAERVMFVLANTVQHKDWDGRFSRENKAWAAAFSIEPDAVMGMDRRLQFVVNSHPAVLDGFIHMVREAAQNQQRRSVRDQLAHKPALPKQPLAKREARVR